MIQLKVYPAEGAGSDQSIFLDLYETQPIKLTLSIEDITSADATSVFSRTFKYLEQEVITSSLRMHLR